MTPFEHQIAAAWPPESWRKLHVLAAISGGADSVALGRGLARLAQLYPGAGQLQFAHFNHRQRGAESDADAAWVAQLAHELDVPFHTAAAKSAELQSEAAARTERYQFLRHTAERIGARYVVLAHTQDDQIETALFRLFRGSGLAGLAGMPRVRELAPSVSLVRPLLGVRRTEVLAYLEALQQTYRTDSTNLATYFRRNWLRLELLPRVRAEFGPHVDEAIVRFIAQTAEAQELIAAQAATLLEVACEFTPHEVRCQCEPFSSAPPLIAREALKLAWRRQAWPEQELTAEMLTQLLELATRDGAPLTLPHGIHAQRAAGELRLMSRATQ